MSKVKRTFDDLQCYVGNVKELLDETEDLILDQTDEVIVLDFKSVPKILQVVWDQFRETVLECEGKEIVIALPEGFIGDMIRAALTLIGFQIDNTVSVDSPDLVPDHLKDTSDEEPQV